MKESPLLQIRSYGQSIWLDFLRRGMLTSGELQTLINDEGVSGITSNPAIFNKAIIDSNDYNEAIQSLIQDGYGADDIYQTLTTEDVRQAADLLRSIYDDSNGWDGFVSLEVSPHLAYETERTIVEARQLWKLVNRPNVMIKVPATQHGLPAIQQLITEGINVNVTLLFSLARYRKVIESYLAGIKARAEIGLPIERVASVASFFVSRIDVLVDQKLKAIIQQGGNQAKLAKTMLGRVAVAKAKMAYQIYREMFQGDEFSQLARWHARPQRLLFGSTGTKNPTYSDVKYVEALIGPETINTVPLKTVAAYRDHGNPAPRLATNVEEARQTMVTLYELGIDINEVTAQLEKEGVQKFSRPYDELMAYLQQEREQQPVNETATIT